MIRGVPAIEYPEVREMVWPHLLRIERHDKDGMTAGEYEQGILSRDYQLWSLNDFEAICLSKLTRKAVRLEWVVGHNRHKWQNELDSELRQWGRALGKERLIVMARPGWAKLAKERGFREMQRAYEARL